MISENISIRGLILTINNLSDRFDALLARVNSMEQQLEEKTIKSHFTVSELAKYLNKSKSSVYQLCYRKIIPFYKVGRMTYFKRQDVDNWLLSNKINSAAEIKEKVLLYDMNVK